MDNLVVGTVEECKKHEQEGLEGMEESERNRIQRVLDLLANQEERDKCYYSFVCWIPLIMNSIRQEYREFCKSFGNQVQRCIKVGKASNHEE